MIVCRRCQHKNRDDSRICTSCGRKLKSKKSSTSVKHPRTLVGKVINGKYRVLGILGEGGMGIVYKVRHLLLEHRNIFALKILHPRFSGGEHFKKRFMREVEVVMDLNHENIVQIREFGITENNLLFFTMDYFDGVPLNKVLKKNSVFSPGRVIHIASTLLLALTEAHRSNVVHRDLKPDNVLIQTGPRGDDVRILDFGIAKVIEGDVPQMTTTHSGIIGTPKYMSPEQATGGKLDGRSDLYSLGILLYEMLTGRPPFNKGTARSILLAQMNSPPPLFKEVAPNLKLPSFLETFIFRLLAKDPKARPSSAEECLATLRAKGSARVLRKWKRSRRKRAGALGRRARPPNRRLQVLVALLVISASLWVVKNRPAIVESVSRAFAGSEIFAPAYDPVPRTPPDLIPLLSDEDRRPPEPPAFERYFRCELCQKVYADKDKVFNRCHGEPMTEITQEVEKKLTPVPGYGAAGRAEN